MKDSMTPRMRELRRRRRARLRVDLQEFATGVMIGLGFFLLVAAMVGLFIGLVIAVVRAVV